MVMKQLALLVILVACAKGGDRPADKPVEHVADEGPDRCQQITDKLRPVITELVQAAGKTLPADFLSKATDDCRKRPAEDWTNGSKWGTGAICILDAKDQAAVRACFEEGLRDYQASGVAIEARMTLFRLGRSAKDYFVANATFPVGTAGPTPSQSCCAGTSKTCDVTQDWASNPTWAALEVAIEEPNHFQYTYVSDGKTFTATGFGDPLCDGHPVTFTATGASTGGVPTITDPP